jgi:S-adenosyl-L-methionine hydrolase (adenosine-forming)
MTVITLTTDFGEKDGFTGVLKGVIWGICPDAQIADITHAVSAQNVLEGALALWRAAPFFPAGTVHIAVVDPGVGTNRRPMAAQLGSHFYVGPDNGLFTPMIEDARNNNQDVVFVHLDKPAYWLENVSHTFHGRDIFSPVGAHLANGISITKIGTPFLDPVMLSMPKPVRTSTGWDSHVTIIDVFGNVTTDLKSDQLEDRTNIFIYVGGRKISGVVESYGWRNSGELVALVDSEGFIEIAVVNGSAARELGIKVGDLVQVRFG